MHARLAFEASGLASHGALQLDFGAPRAVLRADSGSDVRRVIEAAEAAAQRGAWVVGWLSYEAAGAFDAALPTQVPDGPLVWFGVHDAPLEHDATAENGAARATWADAPCARTDFDDALAALRRAIEAGEVYQVNHTARWQGELQQGSAFDLFNALRREQPAAYAAYIDSGEQQVLSVSPELFFDWDGEHVLTRPMKGTAPRGLGARDDAALAAQLASSPKERAENVMVVDLLRNDLSRVAVPGSVTVPSLFDVHPLPTVWQMTSDVRARTRAGTRLFDLLQALFPCGSVTGAPKRQAMRRIAQHEPDPRGVYCGAVGVLRPGGGATFNVGIRTVVARGNNLSLGVGSGITSGSSARAEWREWHHKAAFAARAGEPFELLETLALDYGQWRHEPRHHERMAQSARYFGFAWTPQAWHEALHALVLAHPDGAWRVRVLCARDGRLQATAHAMGPTPAPVCLVLARQPFASAHSAFVRHKITRRAAYEAAERVMPGAFDTLLWNDDGELTECTRGNVALRFEGEEGWVTPALDCGLLPGIGRQVALDEGRVREAVVPINALAQVREIAFFNSLRGWLPAVLDTAA
ncbi:aminodeoxychorismate synthase component I [Hydrogenophaga sp. 2FB]|uniref:aminodeoxychorismate synthase component I n=1 Tax=Hydrogenophaga sp. 2FB TaxID=2502187 RepID=UPI0010F701C6|nr:aminodeoxychorismate synthase component I [Hydrogenophaga sp. 2FB]